MPAEHLDSFKELGDFITEVEGGPYKVYTALLSQVAPTEDQTSGLLIIGETYTIDTYEDDDDFTNVGALVNETGQVFIATGTTPASWENESELTSAGNPTAVILENTIGDIIWSRGDVGYYVGTLANVFVGKANKTLMIMPPIQTGIFWIKQLEEGIEIEFTSFTGEFIDFFFNVSLEIRIYP